MRTIDVSWLIGEFRKTEMLADAIRDLRSSGFTPEDLDIFSEEPVELRKGVLDRPSNMSLISVLSAIALGSLMTGFVYYAQHDYELESGGMPTFSFWGTGVITYEMTMFGAILGIVATFVWESGLFRRDKAKPVPVCPPNSICLRVRCAAEKKAALQDLLYEHGAVKVDICD